MALKVLMLGWEYPPLKSGGLGTACYGLTKALTRLGAHITFVLPRTIKSELSNHLQLKMTDQYKLSEQEIKFLEVDSLLSPYLDEASYERIWKRTQEELARVEGGESSKSLYGKDLLAEVSRFALVAAKVAREVDFDLIVCHDWMTFDAALSIKHQSGKKLVAHIHAVERDRTGDHPNGLIFDIEKRGLNGADFVIANSYVTQKNVHEQYGVPHQKMQAIHLAIDHEDVKIEEPVEKPIAEKIVSFVGRMTLQKGPEYFIDTAKLVLEHYPNVRFVMAGDGDQMHRMIDRAAHLNIANRLLFTGFLPAKETNKLFKMSDLYVMTSVAEPFGLTVLEALRQGTPCIVPKNAGVAEILHHVLKCDFWDIHALANHIVMTLKYGALRQDLIQHAFNEVKQITWEKTAQQTLTVYEKILKGEMAYA